MNVPADTRMTTSARVILSIGLVVLGLGFLVLLALGIGAAADASKPIQWGTFSESFCEKTRSGCRPIGQWRSDGGSRSLDDVVLVGTIGEDRTAHVGYREGSTSMIGDRSVVRTRDGFSNVLWMPWAGCAVMVLLGVLMSWIYRGRRVPKSPGTPTAARD